VAEAEWQTEVVIEPDTDCFQTSPSSMGDRQQHGETIAGATSATLTSKA
jgi:hypothetical protein